MHAMGDALIAHSVSSAGNVNAIEATTQTTAAHTDYLRNTLCFVRYRNLRESLLHGKKINRCSSP